MRELKALVQSLQADAEAAEQAARGEGSSRGATGAGGVNRVAELEEELELSRQEFHAVVVRITQENEELRTQLAANKLAIVQLSAEAEMGEAAKAV